MLKYLHDHPAHAAFDPDTINILSGALDDAWQRVQVSGARFDGQADVARTILAKHIVEMAIQGERDRQRLIEGALLRLRP
jgi:hypothetical protein